MGLESLAIIVVNYGSHDLLRRNLVSVSAQVPEAHVVVVDNYTVDARAGRVESLCAERAGTLSRSTRTSASAAASTAPWPRAGPGDAPAAPAQP